MTHVFLSPHYDDAAYSCGGTIHQLTLRGERALVMTIMGGDPPNPLPNTPLVRDLHQRWRAGAHPVARRRTEDTVAANRLGADAQHLSFTDCIYRTGPGGEPLYPTEDSLWNKIHPNDPALNEIDIHDLLPQDTQQVYAPLGIGAHVDHLLVRKLAQSLQVPVLFYADYPYADGVTLPANEEGQVLVKLTDADIAARIDAMMAYQSQISTFWKSESNLATQVRAYLRRNQNTERYWRSSSNGKKLYV